MESQKTINLLEKTSDNKDLLKKIANKKKSYRGNTEIKKTITFFNLQKPITFLTINHDSIV